MDLMEGPVWVEPPLAAPDLSRCGESRERTRPAGSVKESARSVGAGTTGRELVPVEDLPADLVGEDVSVFDAQLGVDQLEGRLRPSRVLRPAG